jgi:hypothetical protein
MRDDLILARSLGWVVLRDRVPEVARLDPPFLRYDPSADPEHRAAIVRELLAQADKRVR